MVTEAASTGKPVHVIELEGGSRKFDNFHRLMREAGVTRPFTGTLESWRYDPPNDTARAAAAVRRLMGLGDTAGKDGVGRKTA
jgi:mitochondrial fission protein ELM1